MEGLVSHVLDARSDTRRTVRCGCRYESLDDWSTVLIRELECASVHNKLEIGCSPVIVTSSNRFAYRACLVGFRT